MRCMKGGRQKGPTERSRGAGSKQGGREAIATAASGITARRRHESAAAWVGRARSSILAHEQAGATQRSAAQRSAQSSVHI